VPDPIGTTCFAVWLPWPLRATAVRFCLPCPSGAGNPDSRPRFAATCRNRAAPIRRAGNTAMHAVGKRGAKQRVAGVDRDPQ
jgi:hypothetical protein